MDAVDLDKSTHMRDEDVSNLMPNQLATPPYKPSQTMSFFCSLCAALACLHDHVTVAALNAECPHQIYQYMVSIAAFHTPALGNC